MKEEKERKEHELMEMPFIEHLRELRERLIKVALSIFVMSLVSFYFADKIFTFLKEPVLRYYPKVNLITLSPTEPLFILLKVSLACGVILSFPIIAYQFWRFVEPALYESEKKKVIPLMLSSILLFSLGLCFAYFLVLPLSLKFLIGIGIEKLNTQPMLSINLYISFLLKMLIAFGLAFEMPIVLLFLQRAGIITKGQLKKFRRYFIFFSFVVGAFIAPDVLTQILMAIPLIILYEISIHLG